MRLKEAVIAANRFGLGARPGELRSIAGDPRGWLRAQLEPERALPAPMQALPSTASDTMAYMRWVVTIGIRSLDTGLPAAPGAPQTPRSDGAAPQDGVEQSFLATFNPRYEKALHARIEVARTTERPFFERLVHFWSNHFAISSAKAFMAAIPPSFERDVARRHATGSFEAMLLASTRHPGMLYYLDNWISIGPNSRWGRNPELRPRLPVIGAPEGLNENLAREILELHTLGVDGGYTQADVTSLARIITGWTVPRTETRFGGANAEGGRERLLERLRQGGEQAQDRAIALVTGLMDRKAARYSGDPLTLFDFAEDAHEPGTHYLLGKAYDQPGVAQGEAALKDLARHPSTANFVATKLARHFVADDPPPPLVARLARAFRDSEGDIATVMNALIDAPESWAETRSKLKRPEDYVISALRAAGDAELPGEALRELLEAMGQKPYYQPGPDGWPDTEPHWLGADPLWKRIEWALRLSQAAGFANADARRLGEELLGGDMSRPTRDAIGAAPSPAEAVAMLLISPEFQRR